MKTSSSAALLLVVLVVAIITSSNCLSTNIRGVSKAAINRIPPQLPSAFNATVTTTLPFIGKVTGPFYYDYDNSRIRQDISMFGSSQASLSFYNEMIQYDIMLPSGPCQSKKIDTPFYPLIIPPFSTYVGDENVNGLTCQHWMFKFPGMTLDFWVTETTSDGKSGFVLVKFTTTTDPNVYPIPFNVEMIFKNIQVGPQPDSLFGIWRTAGCPVPKPPVIYTLNGYTKNAMNAEIIPGIKVSLSYSGSATQYATSTAEGLFTFPNIPSGVNVTITTQNLDNPGYLPVTKSGISVLGNINAGSVADLFLSPVMKAGTWRVVLTWGNYPRDLDAHLRMPNGCDTNYGNKICNTIDGKATLDHDMRNGFGPETMTIVPNLGNSPSTTPLNYYVYNYSNEASYVNSTAVVSIYNENGLFKEVVIPRGGYAATDRFWKVFTLLFEVNKAPTVTIVNTVGNKL